MDIRNHKLVAILNQAQNERDACVALLAEELLKKRLAIFMGAGCSVAAGLPSWNTLIFNLLERYQIRTKDNDLLRLGERLERLLGANKFRELVAEMLTSRIRPDTSLYEALARLDVDIYLTTNYDHLFEEVLVGQNALFSKVYRDDDLPTIDFTQKTIVKLHGDLDSYSSLILTSGDYDRFPIEHKALKDWLYSAFSQRTILFVGTSFEDPRLKDADSYAIALFGKFRRQPFIFMRVPQKNGSQDEEGYETSLDDFVALRDDFKRKGYHTIIVEKFDDIPPFLQELRDCVMRFQLRDEPQSFQNTRILEIDYIDNLENKLNSLLDNEVMDLSRSIRGNGRLPIVPIIFERVESLVTYINNPPHPLTTESQFEAHISIADGLLMSLKGDDLKRARQHFERANTIYQKNTHNPEWKLRLIRVCAKLLFLEGKIDDALNALTGIKDDRTLATWLAILIDSQHFAEAYTFLTSTELKPEWVCESLIVFVHQGDLARAEQLFSETISELDKFDKQGNLSGSAYKDRFFFEKLCHAMTNAYFREAIEGSRERVPGKIFPYDMTVNGKELCRKALQIVDILFSKSARQDIKQSYYLYHTMLIEMAASALLGLWQRSNETALQLASYRPIDKRVVEHIIARGHSYETSFLEQLADNLIADYPNESWAWLDRSLIQAEFQKRRDDAWTTFKRALELSNTADEKHELAFQISGMAINLEQAREAVLFLKATLQTDDLFQEFLSAELERFMEDKRAAKALYETIIKNELPSFLLSETHLRLAEYAMEEGSIDDARMHFEDAVKNHFNEPALKGLLSIVI